MPYRRAVFGHPNTLVDRQRQRLFAIDIFTGFHRVDRDQRVPMVRRGDERRIDIGAIEELAKILVSGNWFTLRVRTLLGTTFTPNAIDIAHRDDFDLVLDLAVKEQHV